MQCRDAREVLSALIDGEDAGERQQAAAAHVASCSLCTELANDYRRIGEHLRAAAYVPTPSGLSDKVRVRLAAEVQPAGEEWRLKVRRLMQQAAVLVVACGLSALLSWHLTRSVAEQRRLERDIVSAHVRTLLQDSMVQIASSDRHTVRPWFTGRLDFAPNVKDLTVQDFPLVGGRLDWIDGKRVGTVVYKRRLHTINVFMWPTDLQTEAAPLATGLKGYNAISWTRGGIMHWAVSDLNAKELAELQALF